MSDNPAPISPAPRPQADAPVHCPECGKYSDREAVTCSSCESHLWIKCSKCKAKNPRTASRCAGCHQQLRPNLFARERWKPRRLNRKQKRLLRRVGVLLIVGLVLWLVYHSLPEPHLPPPNTAVPPV